MTYRVLVIAQAFKGTLTAREVAEQWESAVGEVRAEARVIVGSDGGDGLLEALDDRLVRTTEYPVTGPLGRGVIAPIGWLSEDTAVVESRFACGLSLLGDSERDPLRTTTRGVGELIQEAQGAGASRVYVGLGGSATADGGTGMASVWGWDFLDESGQRLISSAELDKLHSTTPGRAPHVTLVGLCDVNNPLTGPDGAVMYVGQKGGSLGDELIATRGLSRLAQIVSSAGGGDFHTVPGAGAAGGLGFGLLAFGGGSLVSGASWVLDAKDFDQQLGSADLVVTGEGRYDQTSLRGKLSGEVLRRCADAGVPVLLVAPDVRPADTYGSTLITGGGVWDARELFRRTRDGLESALRLLAP